MDLTLQHPGSYLFVRHVGTDRITLGDRELTRSFILARDRVIEDWPVADVDALAPAAMEPALALHPEVVLLGTGERQRFPPAAVMAALLGRGIGCEVMDNAAAARTYAVLAGEDRAVVAAFILPGD